MNLLISQGTVHCFPVLSHELCSFNPQIYSFDESSSFLMFNFSLKQVHSIISFIANLIVSLPWPLFFQYDIVSTHLSETLSTEDASSFTMFDCKGALAAKCINSRQSETSAFNSLSFIANFALDAHFKESLPASQPASAS